MRINSINNGLQNKSFGSFNVEPKAIEYIHESIFKNQKNVTDAFDVAINALKEAQKENPYCDMKLYKGINIFTGDTCPAIGFYDKGCDAEILQIKTHDFIYNNLSEASSLALMIQDANKLANNFESLKAKIINRLGKKA